MNTPIISDAVSASNSFFSPGRMLRLIRKESGENWRSILLACAGIFGLFIIVGLLICNRRYFDGIDPTYFSDSSGREMIFWTRAIFFVGGVWLASIAFQPLATPPGARSMLMTPASQFEKFIMRWLVAVPVFLVMVLVCSLVADWIRVGWIAFSHGLAIKPMTACLSGVDELYYLSAFICIQSFFLLGSVVWPKHSLVKTLATVAGLAIAYFWISYVIVRTFSPAGPTFYDGPEFVKDLEVQHIEYMTMAFLLVVALFNYCLAYFRFRESEIINRW